MPISKNEPHVRIRRGIVIIFLIGAIAFMTVGHFVLVAGARGSYREEIGTGFSQRADNAQEVLLGHLERLSAQVANLTTLPEIRSLVQQANEQETTEIQINRTIPEMEDQWRAMIPQNSRFLRNILENPVSQFLQDYSNIVIVFREILVTDAEGRLVAASNKTTDYFQGDERWWGNCYLDGAGNRYISDITFDESANVFGLEIAQPIRDPSTDEVIGVIKAIADSAEIFATVDSIRVGQGGGAVLMRSDGTVIHSPFPTSGYEFLVEDFRIERGERRYVEALERQAFREENLHVFLGLPQFYFRERLPELDWYVLIQAPYSEVFAPFSDVNRWFVYLGLFSVAVVVSLSLILSWRLGTPALETDPHLEKL